MKRFSKISTLALTGICLSSAAANAAGWQLNDYSMTGLGRAYAGAGVAGDDYSALAYNPAGMTLAQTSGAQIGAAVIYEHSDVKAVYGGRADDLNADIVNKVPNLFAQYRINDRVTAGFGIYVPFGLSIEYDRNWIGSDHGIHSELTGIDYSAGVAVKATDKLSLGFAAIARQAEITLTSTTTHPLLGKGYNRFEMTDWSSVLHFGAMYEINKDSRVGVSYRTRSQQAVKGRSSILNGTAAAREFTAKLTTDAPEQILISGYHKINDKVALSGLAKWTRWTRFKTLSIANMQYPALSVEVSQRWKNVWNLAVGADYFYSDKLTLRAGVGFDKTPVPNNRERTASIPDNDRWEFSVGASYKAGKNLTYDIGYMFLYLPHYSVLNARHNLAGTPAVAPITAKYQTTAHVLGLQVQYAF